jgi:phage terminase small subunit
VAKKPGRLVLSAGRRPHLRKASRANWTKAKEREFVSALAETCNVTQAAREAGVSVSYAYKKRAADAEFRASWIEALGVAYQRLELVLLDRAFNGTEKLLKRKDGSEERMLEYSNQLGLTLLKMHRESVGEASMELPPDDIDEVKDRLIKKLQRLKARNDAQASPDE